jgi:hypothetical protein
MKSRNKSGAPMVEYLVAYASADVLVVKDMSFSDCSFSHNLQLS